jgi:hypothetical protein
VIGSSRAELGERFDYVLRGNVIGTYDSGNRAGRVEFTKVYAVPFATPAVTTPNRTVPIVQQVARYEIKGRRATTSLTP